MEMIFTVGYFGSWENNINFDKNIREMANIFLIGTPGPFEIIIIVIILLLLFGGRKIPELMRGLGQGMKEFKKATKEEGPTQSDTSKAINTEKDKE